MLCELRGQQIGQALPIGLVLIAFSVFVGITLFNTAQVSTEKLRVTNASDAAAYSGLLWQARAMNFQSYTNRAMVANQVSIAQAVTLRSWSRYAEMSTVNVNRVLGGLPFVGAVTNAMEAAVATTAPLINGFADALLVNADKVNGALSVSQDMMFKTGFAASPEIIRKVATANDPDYRVESSFTLSGLVENQREWSAFTSSYGSDNAPAMQSRAQVIEDSRGSFTRRRDWDFLDFWFYTTPVTRHKLYRRGATELIYVEAESVEESGNVHAQRPEGRWEWKAKDSLSLQNRIWRPFRGTKRVEMPIGWAQSFANSGSGTNGSIEPCDPVEDSWSFDDGCPKWLGGNRSAEHLASIGVPSSFESNRSSSSIDMSSGYSGIREFRDLTGIPSQEKDPRLTLRVEVFAPAASVPTSDNTLQPGELLAAKLNYGKGEIAAVSGSELYFRHPKPEILGNGIEYANGYNPYWDVRLTALSKTERLGALLARAPAIFGSGGSVSPPPVVPSLALLEPADTSWADSQGSLPLYTETEFSTDSDEFWSVERDTSTFQYSANRSGVDSNHFFQHALLEPGSIDTAQEFLDRNFALSDETLVDGFESLSLMSDGISLENIQNTMVNEVETVIVDAVTDLVTGAFTGLGREFSRGNLANALSGFQDFADSAGRNITYLDSALDAVVSDMRVTSTEIEGEVERIKESVARRYEEGLVVLEETIDAEVLSAQSQIELFSQLLDPEMHGVDYESVWHTLNLDELAIDVMDIEQIVLDIGLVNENGIVSNLDMAGEPLPDVELVVQQEIWELESQVTDLADSRESRQAQLLIDVVNSETDLFDIDMDTALRVVDLIRESEDPLDPLSVTEGEEAENEDGYVIYNR